MPQWCTKGPHDQVALPGTRGRGQTFERRVGRRLAAFASVCGWQLYDHTWIKTGLRWLQPDFVLVTPSGSCLLVECKLTWVDATNQLHRYRQALREMSLFPSAVLAVRNLTPEAPAPIHQLEDAYDGAVWHVFP